MSAPEPGAELISIDGGDPTSTRDDPRSTSDDLDSTLGALAAPALVPRQRRRLLRQLGGQLPRPRVTAWRPRAAADWAADTVGDLAPHVPVRELPALRRHHRGLDGEALAERLVRNAARATAGIGAASGGLAAVKWAAPPTLLAAPALLGAETVAVVAVEIKLIGELYEAYRVPLPGAGTRKAVALLQSWAQQRGIHPLAPGAGVTAALGTATRQELADRLARRFCRNLPTLAPLLAGAAVAGYLNQRATRALGHRIRADLVRGVAA